MKGDIDVPGLGCEDCGVHYFDLGADLVLPDQVWRVIHPSGEGGILCANCICRRVSACGGTAVLAWVNNLDYSRSFRRPAGLE